VHPLPDFNFPLEALLALDDIGTRPALSTAQSSLSGTNLSRITRGFASRLAQFGVNRETTLLVSFQDGVQTVIAALAASLLGARWTIYDPNLPYKLLHNLRIVSDGKLKVTSATPHAVADRHWFSGAGADGRVFPGYTSATDVCGIAPSSGTTGTPKYMERMAGSLAIEFATFDRRKSGGYFGDDSFVSARFPVGSFLGFQQVLVVLLAGGRLMLANPADKLQGELAAMAGAGVTHVLSSPSQVSALCADAPELDRKFKSLLVAGAMVTPTMLRHWLRYFESVRIGYTSRESAGLGFAHLTEVVDTRDLAYELDKSGEVQVVDEEGRVLAPGQTGILRFRRPYMVTSYIGAPEASAEAFRDGWFHPGDLGHLDAQGRLHVTGRQHDQINLGGVKFNAAAVDAAAAGIDGVEAAMCFSAERGDGLNELKLCLALRPGVALADIAQPIRLAVKGAVHVNVVAIYEVPNILANENGKPLRMYGPTLTANLLAV